MVVEKGVVDVDEGAAAAVKEVVGGDMITLKSSDGKLFKVLKEAAERLSKFLKKKICDDNTDGDIKLKRIDSEALEKVVDYLNKHANDSDPSDINFVDTATSEDLKEWDRKLVDDLTEDAVSDLITAANFLGIKGLLNPSCQKVADMIASKTPGQVRRIFNIANDFTEEEKDEIRKEYPWVFDDEETSDEEEEV